MKPANKRILAGLGAAGVAGALAWQLFLQPLPVTAVRVETGTAAQFVYASGQVVPEEKVTVRAKNNARIARVAVEEGRRVRAGETLVVLESDEAAAQVALARAEVAQAETDLAFSGRELERYEKLLAERAIARRDYDQTATMRERARRQLDRAVAAADAAAVRLEDLVIRSPFDAIVLERILDSGAAVTPSDAILHLAREARLQVEGKVDELDAYRVKTGQQALLSFDGIPGRVVRGTVAAVAPKVDAATKSFKIKIRLLEEVELQPGMSAEVNILEVEKRDALLVPAAAVADAGAVWVGENGRARLRQVRLGIRDGRKAEVLSGLEAGDTVLLNPGNVREGDRVRTVPADR